MLYKNVFIGRTCLIPPIVCWMPFGPIDWEKGTPLPPLPPLLKNDCYGVRSPIFKKRDAVLHLFYSRISIKKLVKIEFDAFIESSGNIRIQFKTKKNRLKYIVHDNNVFIATAVIYSLCGEPN